MHRAKLFKGQPFNSSFVCWYLNGTTHRLLTCHVSSLCVIIVCHHCVSSLCVIIMCHHCVSSLCVIIMCHHCVSSLCVIIVCHHCVSSLCVIIVCHHYVSSLCVIVMCHHYYISYGLSTRNMSHVISVLCLTQPHSLNGSL